METYFDYLRAMAHALGERIVQTYPALQSPKDLPATELRTLLRKALPAQALAITGLAKYLKTARYAVDYYRGQTWERLLMSSRAKRTAAIMAAAITSVDAKRFIFWDSRCSSAIALFISPIPQYRGIESENKSQLLVDCANPTARGRSHVWKIWSSG